MDKDNNKNKQVTRSFFTLICFTYLLLTGSLVYKLSQPIPVQPKKLAAKNLSENTHTDPGPEDPPPPPKTDIKPMAPKAKNAEQKLQSIIMEAANEHEIDPDLIKAIIWAESSFNPKAVSQKGALGLMQLMPSTAKALDVEDCLNPENNVDAGVRYFKQLMHEFDGDEKLALAAYNAGSSKVREYNGVPPFEATRYYIKKVMKYYRKLKDEALSDIDKT
jgi:soluble lytic murein transglycosylase-like protein